MTASPKLLLVDGHSLAFRSYYAFAKGRDGGLRTSTGIPTSVSYGFIKALLETIEAENPDYIAIAFDLGGATYRHEADETYKANRAETPEDFIPDLDNLQEVLKAMNLQIVVSPGYEADDVIGTMARKASAEGFQVKVLSGDRDLFQLVDDAGRIKILYMSTTFGKATPPPKEFGLEEVKDKMGVLPSQIVDFKALCGDTSDNIPGVRGIGEKTAAQLINTYGSLHGIYDAIEQLKGAVKKKLEDGKDSALHSQWMAQIHLDTPLPVQLEDCQLRPFDSQAVEREMERLEFRTFKSKLEKLRQRLSGEVSESAGVDSGKSAANRANSIDDSFDDTWFFSPEETEAATPPPTMKITPWIVDTIEQLNELVERLKQQTDINLPVAWDTETTSLEPRDAELVGIGCCWAGTSDGMAYIPLHHTTGQNLPKHQVLETLRPILESADYPKVLQNAKYDRLILRFQGVQLAGVVFDTMLASYVINPEQKHGLKELSEIHLGVTQQSYDQLVPKGKTIADVSIAAAANYCGADVYTTFLLRAKLQEQLQQIPSLRKLFETVELPLEPVLAEMETIGIRIDSGYLNEFSKTLEQDLQKLEEQAHQDAGQTFNLGSPKQLSELLFDQLGLDRKKSKKTKTGYSTDAATLEKLQGDHPVIDAIIEHRTLSKLKSTYIDKLPTLVRTDTQRVHTDFNQAVTATGRLSSSEPNLQNIPIRTAFSRQIRKAFLPKQGWLLVGADYSQIELRILAHLSQEPTLLDAYRNNQDVHRLTATLLFEKEEITSEERRLAKIINFGVIYGMGAQRFAREAGVKATEAKRFIDRFNERYPRVFAYLQQMQRDAIAQGYVETICGRRRYFSFGSDVLKRLRGEDPNTIDLSQIKLRDQYDAQLLRAAANAPIQGSSADIIKLAMIRLHEQLKQYDANLLLQVHDELVLEVEPNIWPELQSVIKNTMEQAVELTVPLVVEIHAGDNWMETK
ncbi:DNA polymerase I [Alkalinema sp. FACHB-956]|uniref:DNA polymerase I n=1 Tax=Alkalinema sp. FACHB-956 TaxID=2692768 RepID=UPI00168684DF|nr:DNA polymerase I [Alkalinema sp. FACHB-956]MBD2329546.1 DNA polymerase I [Alkalinema sp. FACHB-956]